MANRRIRILGTVLLIWAVLFINHAFGDIKSDMIKRLPIIKELKAKGMIGESNRGYLEFVGSARQNEDVVRQENADRKSVYAEIAAGQKTSIDVVEKQRAVQIEKKALPGEWLQDAAGKWYRK